MPTGESKDNRKENHPESSIVVTGNTAIDALSGSRELLTSRVLDQLDQPKKSLVTMHRRENQGAPHESGLWSSERNGGSGLRILKWFAVHYPSGTRGGKRSIRKS